MQIDCRGGFLATHGNARVTMRERDRVALAASEEIHGLRSLSAILFERERKVTQILDDGGLAGHSRGKCAHRQKQHPSG